MLYLLVDTNILIDYSNGYGDELKNLFELQKKGLAHLLVNPIVVMEYLIGIYEKDIENALGFLSQFDSIPITIPMGILASKLVQKRIGSFWKDALIATCCIEEDLSLATKNVKHFNDIKGLKLYEF
jgi:predicted nucleic acid-binding protein